MSTGKYSPTVNTAYALDQHWWERNGGGTGIHDAASYREFDWDGFDEYGYGQDGNDRAGHTEEEYLADCQWVNGPAEDPEFEYVLHGRILGEWTARNDDGPVIPLKIELAG